MDILKKILNIVMAFILTLLLVANFMIILISNTILSKDYMESKIEENGYPQKIETDLKNGFESYKYQSGLPDEIFENLYTMDMIQDDIFSIISNIYYGTEIKNSSDKVKENISHNINQYLSQNDINLERSSAK